MDNNKNIKAEGLETLEYSGPEPVKEKMPPNPGRGETGPQKQEIHHHSLAYLPTIISLVFLSAGMVLDYVEAAWFTATIRLLWYGFAYILVGGKVLEQAARNIAKGDLFNEFFLMGIATLGAFYIGEYAEGVAVMLFYVIGEHFQDSAVRKSKKSIKSLVDNRPDVVKVLREEQEMSMHPSYVAVGETIRLRAGEKIPLDGTLISESSYFATDALTGESKPQTIKRGEKVLAGMVNLENVVDIKVSAAFADSTLSKVLLLIEEASGRKAKTQRFISRLARVYTPIVVFLALALATLPFFFVDNYVFDEWLYRALVFLVISCPCALLVSIPLGYFGGIGAASKNGILFKGSNFLDLLPKADTLVLDKTGTLTEGVFEVQEVKIAEGEHISPDELLSMAAALESQSNHPVAKAITQAVGTADKKWEVTDVREFSGRGLKGALAGKVMLAGNTQLLDEHQIAYPAVLEDEVETLVAVALEGRYLGHITIADRIKEGASATLKELRQMGVKEILMLSGDKDTVVQSVSADLGIDQAYGGLLPEDKVAKVEVLKKEGKTVAFVGDGINDAPVITLADIGIAMGGLGSDAAIETADVVIQNDRLDNIITAINIGKKTRQVVWQNIGMAFGVKALVLTFGAFGVASLWEAVFADVGVALLAILNAVRIQRMKFR
ncbi:MAG TPA: heavy metal translocating P-type ATPase [Cyclobacteriaceae bacterium]|nr:heavy metal translocating P-type ATPase [Cyclobacteriaceae bacterium]